MYEKYHDKGLVVLGVNVADSRKIGLDYLKENKVTFPIILDISAAARKAMGRYLALDRKSVV